MKIKRIGSCLRCGTCCKSIYTIINLNPNDTKDTEGFKKWLDLHGVAYKQNGDILEVKYGGSCRNLRYKDGEAVCLDYKHRPAVCVEFPQAPSCNCVGFRFEYPKGEAK